ncbi:hypothetical protein LSH36_187g06022 [Paralvinella palmiformis]|uniref:Replication protein A C-terminal domain-containing protein n=1 Tax=Paralvinella palmiformis TaxID=53620 RepID=A0AAD9JT05_9ANNE|nr:hypothetical protein LSH36_187g06022 [Paralvinella palmiformis]
MFNSEGYGDQGGGYMNSQSNFSSPQGGGTERKTRLKPISCLPCTVAQVLSTQQVDDKFMVDNIELNQVTIVGMVRSVKESATKIEYVIDDMTGPPLDVHRVVALRENLYVRVHGHVRSFQGKHHLMTFKIVPITNMNELTYHMLEVIHGHLALTKGVAGGGKPVQYGSDMDTGYQGAHTDPGLSPLQAQVFQAISACTDERGIGITNLFEKLRGIPQTAIREAVDFLSSEGHIYSTIDDDHFKSTESM